MATQSCRPLRKTLSINSSIFFTPHLSISLPADVSLLTRSRLESVEVKIVFYLSGFSFWCFIQVLIPIQRSQLVNPSAPFPSQGGKTPLSFPQSFHWTSLSSPSRFSSCLFLHCFHMLSYPLNFSWEKLNFPHLVLPEPHTQFHIPTHFLPALCVCCSIASQLVSVQQGRAYVQMSVNQIRHTKLQVWKKLVREKKQWWRISL